jgi:hypothetical protein
VLGRSGSVVLEWTGVTLDLRNNCGDSGPRRGAAGCERENRSERPSFAARGRLVTSDLNGPSRITRLVRRKISWRRADHYEQPKGRTEAE